MTQINNSNNDVATTQINSTTSLSLQDDQTGSILLPSNLADTFINLNFTLDGEPIITGLAGELLIYGQYKNSPQILLKNMDLSTDYMTLIEGKYTQLNVSLSGLSGADTVIIYADQNLNI